MTAYDVSAWSGFALAAAICSAALLGLLLMALSLTLERLKRSPRLLGRAEMVLVLLAGSTLTSLAVLVPGQSAIALGLELALVGLGVAILDVVQVSTAPADPTRRSVGVSALLPLVPAAALVVGGLSVETAVGGGLFWVLGAVFAGILVAVAETWSLLVEASG